jgi:hypothetical protein
LSTRTFVTQFVIPSRYVRTRERVTRTGPLAKIPKSLSMTLSSITASGSPPEISPRLTASCE